MTTPAEYRAFALTCLHWAENADDAGQRDTLVGIARVWFQTAVMVDQYVTLAGDEPARLIELSQALN